MEQIVHAVVADAAEILELQKLAYQSEAATCHNWSIPPLIQTLNEIEIEFSRTTFLKVTTFGRIIGSVRASVVDDSCEISRLIVHPYFQRRGIGTQLMVAVEGEFPNVKRFELFTGIKSENNIRFYERLGYKTSGTKHLSSRVDLVFMEKWRH